jgi:hypothetical protein
MIPLLNMARVPNLQKIYQVEEIEVRKELRRHGGVAEGAPSLIGKLIADLENATAFTSAVLTAYTDCTSIQGVTRASCNSRTKSLLPFIPESLTSRGNHGTITFLDPGCTSSIRIILHQYGYGLHWPSTKLPTTPQRDGKNQ